MNNRDTADLKKRVVKSLDALIDDPVQLKKQFISLVKALAAEHKSTIPPKEYPALFDLIHGKIKEAVKCLKTKNINDDHREIYALVFLLVGLQYPVFTLMPGKTDQLRALAKDCKKELQVETKLRQSSSKRK